MTEDYDIVAADAFLKHFRMLKWLCMYEELDLLLYNIDVKRDILYIQSLMRVTAVLHKKGYLTEWINARNRINTELVSKKQWTMFEYLDGPLPELKFT